jgi:hypothetical protein
MLKREEFFDMLVKTRAWSEQEAAEEWNELSAASSTAAPNSEPPQWAIDLAGQIFSHAIEWNEGEKRWDNEHVAWLIISALNKAAATPSGTGEAAAPSDICDLHGGVKGHCAGCDARRRVEESYRG